MENEKRLLNDATVRACFHSNEDTRFCKIETIRYVHFDTFPDYYSCRTQGGEERFMFRHTILPPYYKIIRIR